MIILKYYPEGTNAALFRKFESKEELKEAMKNSQIAEGKVLLCDKDKNLHIDLGFCRGIIPYKEGAFGIQEGTLRDIALISKVNKKVCFRIIGFHRLENGERIAVLSRRSVQIECLRNYIEKLKAGDIISAAVTHIENFGAFIDIGCGINSLIPIDMLSVSRISSPSQRLSEGQIIKTVLRKREEGKLTFSLKELLGTWEENAAMFCSGETVGGIVRSVEPYGVFIELAPNLAGLAEYSPSLREGQNVSVYIKSILPEKMKIKLAVVEAFDEYGAKPELKYFVSKSHISSWNYSPPNADKIIQTVF
ncbi:MAG: S1 RNA-binding domain-containing protein [Eubacterium sp.]|nr:S1 RNA-binding domain-containing protein [Eubacterium sp.]